MTTPATFRGIPLRPASDWSDPTAEGVFVGVSNADYHAAPGFSGTQAASFRISPAHSRIPVEIAARSRDIGTLVHGDILEGLTAEQLGFVVLTGVKTTTKAGHVTEDMTRIAKDCAEAIRDDHYGRIVARGPGLRELSVRVRCPESGLMLKCRIDYAPVEGAWMWDIKTTSSESPGEFENAFGEFGYDISGSHYLRVAQLAGLGFEAMGYMCVSTAAPHETWVKQFGVFCECYDISRAAAIAAAKTEALGVATGVYPKRKHKPSNAEIKPWHMADRRRLAGIVEE